MAYFICEKQGRCCPHEFYDSIEQAITDSEDGVPCDHLIEVDTVRHGRWVKQDDYSCCSGCGQSIADECVPWFKFCPNCGCKMLEDSDGEK